MNCVLTDSVAEGIQQFRLSLTNATGGRLLGSTSTTVSINDTAAPGAFYSFSPNEASSLSFLERDGDVNVLLHYYGTGGRTGVDEYVGLRPLADSRGFLYSLPNGTINQTGRYFWNATDACCDFYGSGVDDALYLRQFIETIGQVFAVDSKRVYTDSDAATGPCCLSQNFNWMDRQPDVQLFKAGLQTSFETSKKLAVFLRVLRINKYAIEPISVFNSSRMPDAFDNLRLPRNSAEPALDLSGSPGQKFARHRSAIVKHQRQKNLEATVCVHAWRVPQQ